MPNELLTDAIDRVSKREDLSTDEAAEVLGEIMGGGASEVEVAAFLIALRTKGESVDEIVGLARTMRSFALGVSPTRTDLVDTAGTGGGATTFNVSTTAALIAAGAGCAVAKHGNRSATSRSGSADLLEALGARINLSPDAVAQCIDDVGFGFMFAPAHHAATKYVVPVRKELAVRTIFNFLGPLTNPAGAKRQIVGVYDPSFLDSIANALLQLGTEHSLVVSGPGLGGIDEISTWGQTEILEVQDGAVTRYQIQHGDFGIEAATIEQVAGGSPDENAAVTTAVFAGESGPPRDLAAINAAAAIYVAGRATSLGEGLEIAYETLDSGAARVALERYVELTNDLAPSSAA